MGAGIPLTTGAALTAKVKKSGAVAVAFFGDGASNQGQFHESLNMAANWKLPALYVVENNGWGEFTPTEFVVPVKDISVRADSYAMNAEIADGMDFFDVHEKAGRAIERARRGEGPTLLECKTYRFMGHFVGDPLRYRLLHSGSHWDGGEGGPLVEELRPLYPDYFEVILDPADTREPDLRPLRDDIEREPVGARNFDALHAMVDIDTDGDGTPDLVLPLAWDELD